jgi:hypothetical protein
MPIRGSALCAMTAALAMTACSTAPLVEGRSPRAARELAEALQGRTPGPAMRCLPAHSSRNQQVIDEHTILYRDGRTTYVQNPRGGCPGLGRANNTLVTRLFGTDQLCDGDISQVVDLSTGMGGGSCVFGPFVPYTRI